MSLNHPHINFRKQSTQKKSGCSTPNICNLSQDAFFITNFTLSNTTEYYVQHKMTVAVPGIRSWISPSQKRDEMIAYDLKSYVIY